MPSVSKKQHNFMAAVANNPSFASKAGVPQSVGADFEAADKGLKFGKGSSTTRADLQKVNNPKTLHGKASIMKKGGTTMATKKMNPFAKFEKSGKDVEKKGMKEGSKAEMAMDRMQMMKKGGGVKKMAAGGFTKEANGVAQRGLTKGKQIKMNKGGKAC
jgi:hypothetical protein